MRTLRIWAILQGLFIVPAFAQEGGATYDLGINGLSCPFCSYGIEKELSRIEGVEKITVDIAKAVVRVRMRGGKTLTEVVAKKAAKDAGFTLRSFAPASPK